MDVILKIQILTKTDIMLTDIIGNKMAEMESHFTISDYVVFGLTLAASIIIGVIVSLTGGKQKTASEYLYGDHRLSVVPVALSLVVSFVSSIMMQVN